MSATHAPQPIVILISGRGSNMRTLIEHSRAQAASYEVVSVLSDQPQAAGLVLAASLGIAARAIAVDRSLDRALYDRRLADAIDASEPALIVLAGFMRILSAEFVERYTGRIMNIHPSLLPTHPGLHTHRKALAARDTEHGATVHFVTAELDGGPPIVQARVKIEPDDDETTLATRVQALEQRIYPLAVSWYCEGRLRIHDGQAWLDGRALLGPVQYAGPTSGSAA